MTRSADPKSDEHELLTAYLDGVGELTPQERRAVEAGLPASADAVAETRDLLAALRALPAEGEEPAWNDLAARISAEVGDQAPRRWWQRMLGVRTLLPALAACALVACVVLHAHGHAARTRVATSERHAMTEPQTVDPAPAPTAASRTDAPAAAMYLDDEAVDLGGMDVDDVLGDLGDDDGGEDVADDALLPTQDLAWLDHLDPASLARADRWLHDRKGS